MRPVPGVADSRQGGGADDGTLATSTAAPIACFIATEDALDTSSDDSRGPRFNPTCSYRKRSRESTCHSARSQSPSPAPTRDSIASLSSSTLGSDSDSEAPHDHSPFIAPEVPTGLSRPLSTISMSTSSPQHRGRSTAPSSNGRSRREAAPQLIMPSLAVPQRRPFSDAGKSVGKLRIMVAGQSGIGKTSLIQAIAHSCEHIVHMDPVASTSHDEFSEMWASTKPRPWWRGELDHGNPRRRRRPSTSEILDRNLCFVVRSAFHRSASHMAESDYIDSLLSPILEKPVDDSDLWNILSGGGQPIVDAMLYMIPHTGLETRDVNCIKSLQNRTNIIPLLARADKLDPGSISSAKEHIRQQIDEHGLDCFSFASPGSDTEIMDVFSVSSATHTDYDVMDASVLMSSGYVQPLVATDLARLVEQVFSMNGSAWLKHSAATKCVQWRRDQERGLGLRMALTHRDPSKCALSPVLTVNPFVQSRSWDRIEVSNWAQGLRHSLKTEQMHHVAQQRFAGEVHRRQISRGLVRRPGRSSRGRNGDEPVNFVHQDPLGLLQAGSRIKTNGQLTFELISSLGLVGCVAAWAVGPEWAFHRRLRQLSKDILGWTVVI